MVTSSKRRIYGAQHASLVRRVSAKCAFALLLCGLAAVAGGLSSSVEARPRIGINVGIHAAPNKIFADVMKTSRDKWITIDTEVDAPADANGWTTTDAKIYAFEGVNNNHGTYKLSFNGQADMSVQFGYANVTNKAYSSSTNTTTANLIVTQTGNLNFILSLRNTRRTSTSALNTGVTNVCLMRPTSPGSSTPFADNAVFNPAYGNVVSMYDHIRHMDGTNFNISKTWAERTRPNENSQMKLLPGQTGGDNGVAWEYQIMFANQYDKDLWLCFPADANDDYIEKVALMCRYGSDGVNPYTSTQTNPVFPPLEADRKLYLEYSNEVWNYSFSAFNQAKIRAENEIAANPSSPLNYDGTNPKGLQAAIRFAARQAVVISNKFRAVFGDAAMPGGPNGQNPNPRIRPLYEYQYHNEQDTATLAFDFLNNYYNNGDGIAHVQNPRPIWYYIYGGGGSPYYNNNLSNDVNNAATTTIDQIFNSGLATGLNNYTRGLVSWAKFYGLKTVGYEGGMSVGGDVMKNNAYEARWDPRAKGWELTALDFYSKAGGDAFTFGTYFQYDFRRPISEWNTSPLQQGVLDVTSGAVVLGAPNMGTAVPGTVPGAANNRNIEGTGVQQYFRTGAVARYLVRANSAGNYNLVLRYDSGINNNKLRLIVNGNVVTTNWILNNSGGWGVRVNAAAVPITLKAGQNGIIIALTSGDMNIESLTFSTATASNLVSNPGFESEQYATQTPSGWSEGGATAASYTEAGNAASGGYHGTHWSSTAYNVSTYQTKTGLANGLYTLRVKAKHGGHSSNVVRLYASDYGGGSLTATVPIGTGTGPYFTVQITGINVTNGTCTIGINSQSNGGSGVGAWSYFDDFEFFKQ